MAQRKALGRGLSALLGTPDLETDQLREIDIERILPNAHQPRRNFDEESLNELDPSDRQLIEGKYLLGSTVKELSAVAGATEKAVESRLVRLRRALRQRVLKKLKSP